MKIADKGARFCRLVCVCEETSAAGVLRRVIPLYRLRRSSATQSAL